MGLKGVGGRGGRGWGRVEGLQDIFDQHFFYFTV